MANGAFKFKDNSGNVVSFISGSGSNISFSGGTLDLSGMTGLTLGNLTLSGTTQNALSASHAASYLLTSSFNTYSGTTDTVIGTLQTSTSSLNSFTSSATTRLNSIETSSGSLNTFTSSATTRLNSIEGVSGSYATTGSNLFKGNQTISGSIIPAVDNAYDLGSVTHQFRDLYLSSASLYIDGTKVLGSTAQELQITTDTGQSFKILEAGSDNITLQSADGNIELKSSGGGDVILDPTTGVIALKGTTTLYAGNKILSSDGNAIQIGNSATITGSLVVTGFIETQELRTTYISSSILYRSGSTKFGDELSDTHSFTGSLLVSGSIGVPGSGLISGSSQLPSGIISGSVQLPSGIVSSSAQTIANLPSGTVSGSFQVLNGTTIHSGSFFNGISVVSGSAQVDVMSTTNIARLATTGSNVFTGALTGTTATFSGDLRINNNNWLVYTDSTATARNILTLASNDNLYLQYKAGSNFYLRNTDGDLRLTIDSAGAFTFSGKIAFGTTPASEQVRINQTTGNNSALLVTTTGIAAGQSYGLTVVAGTNSSDRSFLVASQASVDYFKIRGDGAATFSSSVNVIGVLTVGNAVAATNIEFNLSGVSGKAKRIQFQDGVTGQWLLGQGAASETSAFELYNATGTIVLSVNKTTNISTFNGSTTFAAKTNGNNISLSSNGTAMEMYNTSGTVKNWQISSQVVNSQCMDFTPSTANGGTTYSTPILTIDGEQNRVGVGTGTSRPLTLFHTYSATDNLSTFQAGSASYGVQLRFRHGSTLTGFINSNTTNIFSVYNTNSTELLSVTPGGDVFHYGGTSNQGLWTYVQVGSCTGQNTFNFDVTVGDEGGSGNIFKVEAGFAHYSSMSYNCLAEFYISCRSTSYATTDVVRVDTAYGGSFTATKSDAATLRVTKNAGSYPGGGRYWIRVTKVTY